MDQPTVCILHYAGPPVVGGVESTINHHARLLSERGYRVRMIAGRGAAPSPNTEFIQLTLLDSKNPQILEVSACLAQGQVPDEFFALRDEIAAQLRPVLASAQYVIVHNVLTLHKNLPFTAALHALSQAGLQIIAWCHDFAWQDRLYTSGLHSGYPWELLSRPWKNTAYVVVSQHRRKKLAELLDLPEQEIEVITPGVDRFEFLGISPATKRLFLRAGLERAAPLLLLPARITRRKNIEFGLEVMHHLRMKMPAAQLAVTGPPGAHNPTNIDYLEKLLDLRSSLDLDHVVRFLYQHGESREPLHLAENTVAELFRLADALLFPSKREGFGIPILEAGLARTPVFAADIPAIRESLDTSSCLFHLERTSPEEVAQLIESNLKEDQAYQLRMRVRERFTWQAVLENKILPLFERMSFTHE